MGTVKRIAKNTAVVFAAQGLGYVLSFLYMMYNARYLGAAGFGILTFAIAFAGIFGVVTDFGLQSLTVREVARDRTLTAKYLANLSGMKIVLATVTFGLVALTINLLGYPPQTVRVVYLITFSVIAGSFTLMFHSVFQAYEKMEYQALGQVLHGILMLAGVLWAIRMKATVAGFALLYVAVSVCVAVFNGFVINWKLSSEKLLRKIETDWNFWKSTAREALPFGLSMAFVMLFYWIDSVMLSLMKGDAAVGWYNAAYRPAMVLLFIPQSFIAAIYPVMSRFYKTSEDSLRISYEKSFKFLAIIGIPIGVGTMLLAERIILLIFGGAYSNSIIPLKILIWSSVCVFMSVPIGNLFNCLNKQVLVTRITGFCLLLNIFLNLLFIPRYGLIGAAAATLLTEFFSLAVSILLSMRIGYNIFKKQSLTVGKILISVIIMGIFIHTASTLSLGAVIPVSVLLYLSVIYLVKGIDDQDLNLCRMILRERKGNDFSASPPRSLADPM